MKQRTGRQKFHDLRLLTFQDWIVPRYNSHYRNAEVMMKNSRLPVFSYTKMDNGPPLSPISSQFAWAGHTLPDFVQEQSNRLLRRLERPRTADNRGRSFKNNEMKGGKIVRPSTAVPASKGTPIATVFHVNGTRYDTASVNEPDVLASETTANQLTVPVANNRLDNASPMSDRSSSPDFMANLYKEYENEISSGHNKEMQSTYSETASPNIPKPKLLRRPSVQLHFDRRIARKKSDISQTSLPEKIVHCVVKLPSDRTNFTDANRTNDLRSRSEPPKSETWLDLSELCQLSDDEMVSNATEDRLRVPRPSLASESSTFSFKLLEFPSKHDEVPETQGDEKKIKTKSTRPSSSKNLRKSRPRSRVKKRRPHSVALMEESTKEYQTGHSKSEASCKRVRNTDKLREEIETQMSKLDFGNPAHENLGETIAKRSLPPMKRTQKVRTPAATPTSTPRPKRTVCETTAVIAQTYFSSPKSSLPLKKVPIQILSDPFSSSLKVYQKGS